MDLIDRQAAQTELMMKCERYTLARESHGMGRVEWSSDLISVADAMDAIRDLPSAQSDTDEWCTDCKEYDPSRHCCPRFNRVIRETLKEARSEQQWIPCSERLPGEADYKGCQECIDGAVWYYTDKGAMGLGYYYESTKAWSTTYDECPYGEVIAWMPLPSPYQAERREE